MSARWSLATLLIGMAGVAVGQDTVSVTRADTHRVPLTAHNPATASCRGVALISPGVGGSEKSHRSLGEALSSIGFLTIVIGHAESGRPALREQVREAGVRDGLAALTTDPSAYQGRLMDIAAAHKWAAATCSAELSVLIGHSMGAATAMIEAGARNRLGLRGRQSFDAYIAMSPQGSGAIFPQQAWSALQRPVLSLTGTRDKELSGAPWQARTEPYRNMPPGCKWLGVIPGATHTNFAGSGFSARTERLSVQAITAFLNAVQAGDCDRPPPLPGLDLQTK